MTLKTRPPTGIPSWPIIVLAGVEGSGKTWLAAEASGMASVDRAFFVEIGEQMADEYGNVPGSAYEIVEHNSTYIDLAHGISEAAAVKPADGKTNLLIIDSVTELWDLLGDEQQELANKRRGGKPGDEKPITMDQWNVAKKRWRHVIDTAKSFPGPVIMTARLDSVSVIEGNKPTGEKIWKVRAEKHLPYEAQVVLQARKPRTWTLTKIASTTLQMDVGGEMPLPDLTIEKLLHRMGVGVAKVQDRTFVRPTTEAKLPDDFDDIVTNAEANGDLEQLRDLHALAVAADNPNAIAAVIDAGNRAREAKEHE